MQCKWILYIFSITALKSNIFKEKSKIKTAASSGTVKKKFRLADNFTRDCTGCKQGKTENKISEFALPFLKLDNMLEFKPVGAANSSVQTKSTVVTNVINYIILVREMSMSKLK